MKKMNLQENYKRLFKGKASSNDSKLIKESEMSIYVNHMSGGYAELPEELLKALPNKSKVEKLMDTINNMEEEPEPGDPELYKYDEAIMTGLIDLMKKNGITITKDEIEMEDESFSIFIEVDPTKVSALEKLGFEEE